MANEVEILIKATDQASGAIESIGSALGGIGSIAAGVVVAGLGAAAAALGVLITHGAEAQDTFAMFNAVMDKSPLGQYKQQLLDLADAESKVTRFADDQIVAADTVLARYANLGAKLPEVSKLTLDFATFMGTDATSAALQLGKALEDIAGGSLTLLARTRLLTAEQKDHAVAMAKAGDAAGAQAYIIDILNGKVGGLAQTMGTTFAGRMDIFKNTLGEIAEKMGMQLLPVLTPVLTRLTELAEKVAPVLGNILTTYVIPAIGKLVDWLLQLKSPSIIPAPLLQMWEAVRQGVLQVWQSIQTYLIPALQGFLTWFQENQPQVEAFVQRMAWVFSNILVPIVTAAVIAVIAAISAVISVVVFLSDVFGDVGRTANNVFHNIAEVATAAFSQVERVVNAAIGVIEDLIAAILSIPSIDLGGGGGNTRQPKAGQRAGGGPAGGEVWVGEMGPEKVRLPAGSYVHTSGESARQGGGGAVLNFYFPNYVGTHQELDSAIRGAVRKMQLDGSVPS